jgi:hypothetical protein
LEFLKKTGRERNGEVIDLYQMSEYTYRRMHTRIIPAAGALWEALRYILLAVLFTVYFNQELSGENALFFFWITSYLFLMLAALLLAAIRPGRYGTLARLAGAGKAFQFFAGLLLFLYEQNVFTFIRSLFAQLSPGAGIHTLTPSLTAISAIVGIDLIFTLFLLVYSPLPEPGERGGGTRLPRTEITEVEDS